MYPARQQVSRSPLRPAHALILVIALVIAAPQVARAQFGMGGMQQQVSELKLLSPRNRRGDPANAAPISVGQSQEQNAEITEALKKRIDCRFDGVTLKEAVRFIAAQLDYPVFIDEESLAEVGLGSDVIVNLRAQDFQLDDVLQQLMHRIGLTYMVTHGTVKITTAYAAESNLQTRIYPVNDLVASISTSHDALISVLTYSIQPDTWEDVGGAGTIRSLNESLIINQTYQVHQQLEYLLGVLRRFRDDAGSRNGLPASYEIHMADNKGETKQVILDALRQNIRLPESQMTLKAFAVFLSTTTKVNVLVDERALEEIGLDGGTPAQFQTASSTLSVQQALENLAGGLTWQIHAGALVITTLERAEFSLETRLYPVAQLLYGNSRESRTSAAAFEELLKVIYTTVAPDTWDDVGGVGVIDRIAEPPALLISQSSRTHAEIAALLETLGIVAGAEDKLVRPVRERKKPGSLVTEVYPRPPASNNEADSIAITELAELIEKVLGPDAASQRGSILHVVDDRVLVLQTPENHQKVLNVLQRLYPYYQVEQDPRFWRGGGMGGGGMGGMGGGGMGGGGMF